MYKYNNCLTNHWLTYTHILVIPIRSATAKLKNVLSRI